MFFIYPNILFTLFATTHCFDSLSDTEKHTSLSRLQVVPEISCETEWYTRIYWGAIVPALFVYLVAIPTLVWH